MMNVAAPAIALILSVCSPASAQSIESVKGFGFAPDPVPVLKAARAFEESRRAPGQARTAAPAGPSVEPACYERDQDDTADRLRMPSRFCIDSVAVDGGELVVQGAPIEGRFRLDGGKAVLFNAEAGCWDGVGATIYLDADGKVRAVTGSFPGGQNTPWVEEELPLRRLSAVSGAVSLDIPGGLDFRCIIRDHGGRGCPIDAEVRHDESAADTLKVSNITLGESVTIAQADAGIVQKLVLRHVDDDQTTRGLPLRSGKNRVLVETLKSGAPVARKFFDLEASFRWDY